jgi:anti-sigma factor RsiW
MAAEYDQLTLSAYMDGELDRQTMSEVERYLGQ